MTITSIPEKSSIKWLPVPNYENLYEVSELGEIRSVDRIIYDINSIKFLKKGRVLRLTAHKDLRYFMCSLWKNNKGESLYVHRIVCMAFHKNPLNKEEVNHIDGNRNNNHYLNLEWATRQENAKHAIDNKLKVYTNKLTREEFIECLLKVIDGTSYQAIAEVTPYQVPFLSIKIRQVARQLGLEHELNESLYQQRCKRARINGAKNSQQSNQ